MSVRIDPSAQVRPTAVIGSPFRPLLDGGSVTVDDDTVVGAGAWIGNFTVIGQGASVGPGTMIEDFASIGPRSNIGAGVIVTARSTVAIGVVVGSDSVIDGFICDGSRIGAGCRVFGELIHRQLNPTIGWDDDAAEEPAPDVAEGAFIGWRAVIVGGINIGAGAYVCAGALVTKDLPAGQIARGRNEFIHPDAWPGTLGKSPFFHRSEARLPRALAGR